MKTREILRFLLASKHARRALGLLVVQQLIVASSSVWLARLAAAAVAGDPLTGHGALYGASLALPYAPGILALVCLSRWDLDLSKRLVDRFVEANAGRIALWRDQGERARRTSLLSKEGPQALEEATRFIFDLAAAVLNIGLSASAIALVIHPVFAASYALGLALCALLIGATRRRNEGLAVRAQDSSVRFTGVMFRIWDNVLLANRVNLAEWRGNSDAAFEAMRGDRMRSVGFTQLMSGACTALAMLPVAAAAVWYLSLHPSRGPETAALLVTLPRLFMILTVTFHLLSLGFGWSAQFARLKAVFDGSEGGCGAADLASQIDFDRLTVDGGPATLDGLRELLKRPGRLTIRGANGAGKSALLLKLKEAIAEGATYVPANHDLDVRGLREDLSTGQRAKKSLAELLRQDESSVLLLDEWDANLDALNRAQLSEAIQRASLTRGVVEVVHAR